MKNGICPKCNSSEVYAGTKRFIKGGVYGSNTIPVALGVAATLENFVCTNCGYVESYISDSYVLGEIKKNWVKVEPVTLR